MTAVTSTSPEVRSPPTYPRVRVEHDSPDAPPRENPMSGSQVDPQVLFARKGEPGV